ncbi:MAG: hypothetical protein A2020_03390 [Lentisphaerae bacterium GWF2_45_14]|nr:MAG: hypothetical protein A2020_03390 [Lentisphaerae bacterium GWF2_45_14]
MTKNFFCLFFFFCSACFTVFGDDILWDKWEVSKNSNFEIDNKKRFNDLSSRRLSCKDRKDCSIETEAFDLAPNSSYILGIFFLPDEAFIKGFGGIYISTNCGDNVSRASWKEALSVDEWIYLSLRFDTASQTKARIKITIKGSGSIYLASAKIDKIHPPDKGLDLSCHYMQIPFGTRVGDKIFNHLDVKEGAMEFWLRPLWAELNGGHFKDNDVKQFFFWGSQQYENSISIYSWNKFPNLYFALCGENHKQGMSVFYYNAPDRGWRKNMWHHIAVCWKQDGENTRMNLFVDGMPCAEKNAKTVIAKYLKRDMFLGAGKRGNQLKTGKTATSEIALFRISKKQKYTGPFLPGEYKVENDTLCFFPLNNGNEYIGFFADDVGGINKIKAKMIKIGNTGKDNK